MNPDVVRLLNRPFMADPYPALADLRENHAAVPVENGGFRMWLITRYDDARSLLADPGLLVDLVEHRHVVVAQNLLDIERRAKLPRQMRRSVLQQDGAHHRRLRDLVTGHFTPARLASLRPRIERIATDLLDELPTDEPVDLVARYSRPLAATVVSELYGVPEKARRRFPVWEMALLTAPSKSEVEDAALRLLEFAGEMIDRKREQPGDDLFTELVRAHAAGGLDDDELVSMIPLMLNAGMEPASAISSGVFTLLCHPRELARLRDDAGLLTACVEEVLRFETPLRMLVPRLLDHPVELAGVTVPAGELLLISAGAANRDPSRYPDPDRFDVGRDTRGHLGFGHGVHRCLGAELGRLETTIALGTLFGRFPGADLAVPAEDVRWRPGMLMRRLDALPVILRPAGARREGR
ncbi:cytochrome P450 [Cryptosporangium sp. NPDC051539]|uniref:cytochrome P450 n=1 Tax=Cryptosporangium sp. NPDC051539 TaxID=3363962 RepID=UPI00379F6C56